MFNRKRRQRRKMRVRKPSAGRHNKHRKTVLRGEFLEPRHLLAGDLVETQLETEVQTELLHALERLESIGTAVSTHKALTTEIPILQESLNTLFADATALVDVKSVGDVLKLTDRIEEYFDARAVLGEVPSAFGLVEALTDELGQLIGGKGW
ncbi:MAG TPA: hypothetical protein P5307_27460 [Pirellulaceae bacterium]|nr:hypothetical protein [Pirellulaceae bacterium]